WLRDRQHAMLPDPELPDLLLELAARTGFIAGFTHEREPNAQLGDLHMVFGLFRLLGYQFSPRLADTGGARFWRIDPHADYGRLNQSPPTESTHESFASSKTTSSGSPAACCSAPRPPQS